MTKTTASFPLTACPQFHETTFYCALSEGHEGDCQSPDEMLIAVLEAKLVALTYRAEAAERRGDMLAISLDRTQRLADALKGDLVDALTHSASPVAPVAAPIPTPATTDEIAWLVERRGNAETCACRHERWKHTSGGITREGRGRCDEDACQCLAFDPAGVAQWWNGDLWTDDAARALRFARRQDAERMIALVPPLAYMHAKAIEHMWAAPIPTPEERPPALTPSRVGGEFIPNRPAVDVRLVPLSRLTLLLADIEGMQRWTVGNYIEMPNLNGRLIERDEVLARIRQEIDNG